MIKNLIISFFLIITLALISCGQSNPTKRVNVQENQNEYPAELLSEWSKIVKLEPSKVCFMNNQYMGVDQIPVEFEGRTYYGCCEGCAVNLKTSKSARTAKDPFSGKEVDKSVAYIVLNPSGRNDVLYFESEKNYLK